MKAPICIKSLDAKCWPNGLSYRGHVATEPPKISPKEFRIKYTFEVEWRNSNTASVSFL